MKTDEIKNKLKELLSIKLKIQTLEQKQIQEKQNRDKAKALVLSYGQEIGILHKKLMDSI